MGKPEFDRAVERLNAQLQQWFQLANRTPSAGPVTDAQGTPIDLDALLDDIVDLGLARIWQAGGLDILRSLDKPSAGEFIDVPSRAAEIARQSGFMRSPSPTGAPGSAVAEVIAVGVERGQSITDMQRGLMRLGFDALRAERIARTASAYVLGAARLEAAKLAGMESVSWLDAGGSCPLCKQVAARGPVPIGTPFVRKGEVLIDGKGKPWIARRDYHHEPLHPNCRCCTVSDE
ncbi:MAG: hypothetical protein SFY95_08280 [Planctomycetota bacterium]|nr:hypothetical protein [Planctomycetota bacterium]